MPRERHQNVCPGETIRLRLLTYNSNDLADVTIDAVAISTCDPTEVSPENPDGRVLVAQLDTADIVRECTGTYYVDVVLTSPLFTVGRYFDEWRLILDPNLDPRQVTNDFRLYPELWYATPVPVVYDFGFDFQPNKVRKGSRQYLRIRVVPNVPKATDLQRYYENLAIVADLKVSLEQKCGPCVPPEEDLRLIVEEEPVSYKENCMGFYLLDTEALDLAEGVYAIWFTLCIGGNVFLSDKFNFLVYS